MKLIENLVSPLQHCEDATIKLCKLLNVKATKTLLQKDLVEHPDYPGMVSVSDVLQQYGIGNVALKMPVENLNRLPVPFIAHIKGKKVPHALFAIVTKFNSNIIELYNPESKKNETYTIENFAGLYEGVALAAEAEEHAGDKGYNKNQVKEKQQNIFHLIAAFLIPALALAACAAAAFINSGNAAVAPVIFTLLTLAGCTVGTLLLWHEVDEYNPAIKEICHAGKKVNCSAILNSNAAKIFGLSWSLLGSVYFMGMLVALLSGGITNTYNLFLLSWINVIALPYIIYSISYQYFIAKQWCVLCLFVQGVLFLQFITALAGGFHSLHSFTGIPLQTYITISASFAVVFVTLLLLIPALEKAKDSRNKTISLQRLKHNPQIFEALLAKQKAIEKPVEGLGITLGNADAKYKLLKVCNPYCGPCAKAHPIMEELLENNEDLQIQIIFTATDKEDDYRAKPVRHLIAIAAQGDETLTKQALDDWYNAPVKDYDTFAAKYSQYSPLPFGHDEPDEPQKGAGEALKQMSDWCDENKITFTPTFFVSLPSQQGSSLSGVGQEGAEFVQKTADSFGGVRFHQLPEMYRVADLKYFLTV